MTEEWENKIDEEINLLSLKLELGKTAFFGSLTALGAAISLITFQPSDTFGNFMTGILILLLTGLFFILFLIGIKYMVHVESRIGRMKKRITWSKVPEDIRETLGISDRDSG